MRIVSCGGAAVLDEGGAVFVDRVDWAVGTSDLILEYRLVRVRCGWVVFGELAEEAVSWHMLTFSFPDIPDVHTFIAWVLVPIASSRILDAFSASSARWLSYSVFRIAPKRHMRTRRMTTMAMNVKMAAFWQALGCAADADDPHEVKSRRSTTAVMRSAKRTKGATRAVIVVKSNMLNDVMRGKSKERSGLSIFKGIAHLN